MRELKKNRVRFKKYEEIFYFTLLNLLILLSLLSYPGKCWANSSLQESWHGIVNLQTISTNSLQPVIKQFISVQQQNNIKNASIYSLALLKMAEPEKCSPQIKELLTSAAISVSPDYSFPETAYSKLMFQQHRYLKSLMSLFRAIAKFHRNPLESLYASTFFWLALAFITLTMLFCTALLFSIKYYRAFCDMGDLVLSHNSGLTTLLTTITVSIIIVILPAPLPGLLILSVFLALLATRRDILTLIILITSLLIVPFAYEKGMASLLALNSSFFKVARSSTSGINIPENEDVLNKPATNQSQLVLQLFSQSESARQRREYAKAEIFLEKITSNNIKIGAVYNNLANLYILQGNYRESEALFLKAAELEKDSGIPFYNLSTTYIQQNFDLQKSAQALEMAFKRDPSLSLTHTTKNNSESELGTGIKLLFMSLPDDFYRHYADTQPNRAIYLPEFLHQALFPGANKLFYFFLVICSLFCLGYIFFETPANRRICSDCGRLFHPIQMLTERRCPLCHMNNISTANTQLNHISKIKKYPILQPLSNVILLVISVLIPGVYPFLTNHTLLASGLMISAIIWFYNILIYQTTIMTPFPPSSTWFCFIFPLIVWSINLAVLAVLIIHQKQHHNFLRGMS
jgi:tetratricopeptide (TPR) repeat protein